MQFSDLSQAVGALSDMVAPSDYPELLPHEVEDICRACRVTDSVGRLITDPAYQLTIDLNLAAVRCWSRKAAKCTSAYDFSSDNQRFDRSQVLKNCLLMQRHYQSQLTSVWAGPTTQTQKRFVIPPMICREDD